MNRLIVCVVLGVTLLATAAGAQVQLDDPLQGSTIGVRSGGQFVSGGWKVTGSHDSIYWHLPTTVRNGCVSWRVKGLAQAGSVPDEPEEIGLFHSYDYLYSNSDTSHNGYNNNPYKHYIRKCGVLGSVPNALHVYWRANGAEVSGFTEALDWDPNVDYEFSEVWTQDCYTTVVMLWRDDVLVFDGILPGNYEPTGHSVRIGASPEVGGVPINVVFSNLHLYEYLYAPPILWVTDLRVTSQGTTNSLTWLNPYWFCDFTGTMIRCRTDTYPTGPTDGILVCDRAAARGSTDAYNHTVDPESKYYYAAFAHSATFYMSDTHVYAPAINAPNWLEETFDSYSAGNLGGQGRWVTTGAASAQVQSSFANGGTGNAALIDPTGGSTANEIVFKDKDKTYGSGSYCLLTLDVAAEATGADGQDVAYVSIFGSVPITEIARLRIQKGRLQLEYGAGSLADVAASTNDLTWYRVKIGINNSTRKLDVWLNEAPVGTGYAWKPSAYGISKIVIGGDTNQALVVQKAYIDNIRLEPILSEIHVIPDGSWSPSLDKLHFGFWPVAEAYEYKYAIGTTPEGTDVRDWTSCGTSTDILVAGLSLAENQTYYRSLQCANLFGTWGSVIDLQPVRIAPGLSRISDMKALPNGAYGEVRALRGKVVSAKLPYHFYIQEPGSPVGLKVQNSLPVVPGNLVDVCGVINCYGGERYLDCSNCSAIKAVPDPVAVPDAEVMGNSSLGGADLNAYTLGVVGGNGLHNIGLLVTTLGKVTQRKTTEPKYFYVDDGSGLRDGTTTGGLANVGVRVSADPAGYAVGSYVSIVGISSCFESGGLRRQVVPTSITTLRP